MGTGYCGQWHLLSGGICH